MGYKPVALDFASATNPGDGWRSKQQGTQEKSLCRRSNLGLLLESKKYPIPRDGLIYLPTVVINKTFNGDNVSCKCGIIASELTGISASSLNYLKNRIDKLYICAIQNNHDLIILGAWGCGAFKESDDDIKILVSVIKMCAIQYQNLIKTVCAVMGKKNYKQFLN